MTITTTNGPENKREKIRKIQEFHQKALNAIGEPQGKVIPKMAYRPYGKTETHISFFHNEISKGEDIYVEFCSKENDPEDPERTLYKWKFNPHFIEEYEVTEPNAVTGHVRYLVPTGELQVISKKEPESDAKIFDEIPDPETDLPMDQMTIRDYAAIHMRKPVSRKSWLNDLITK